MGVTQETYDSSSLVCLRIWVNVHRMYEYSRIHFLYVRLELEYSGCIVMVSCTEDSAVTQGEHNETDQAHAR